MHLDAPEQWIGEVTVMETGQVEVPVQLPIDAPQKIEVEVSSDTSGVVASCIKTGSILDQVDADQ